jgi:hypothetical protein
MPKERFVSGLKSASSQSSRVQRVSSLESMARRRLTRCVPARRSPARTEFHIAAAPIRPNSPQRGARERTRSENVTGDLPPRCGRLPSMCRFLPSRARRRGGPAIHTPWCKRATQETDGRGSRHDREGTTA